MPCAPARLSCRWSEWRSSNCRRRSILPRRRPPVSPTALSSRRSRDAPCGGETTTRNAGCDLDERVIEGTAFYCGDFVDTDAMSPGRFEPYEGEQQLARIALIDYVSPVPFVDPATGRSPYTVIFAGEEFGCGSSRETAPQALHYAGARVVIARSFARIFYRNC